MNEKPMNVYCVQLLGTIKLDPVVHFGSKETSHLYVVASSFGEALAAVVEKYPGTSARSVTLQNYMGLPIVIGK